VTATHVWVLGRGGMLGSHVAADLSLRPGRRLWQESPPIPWAAPADAADRLARGAAAFLAEAGDDPWELVWCAGAGVTATSSEQLDREVRLLAALLDRLGGPPAARGRVFLSSSAGGVYAGSRPAPFNESTSPRPLAPYGRSKLAMEAAVRGWAQGHGGRAFVGRLSNIYGPGQDLRKPQGLITQLVRSHLLRAPLRVYVPLDTLRDYLYVSDAAGLVVDCLDRLALEPAGQHVVKVLATQQAVTVGAVLGELTRVLRRRPQIVLGASPVARFQAIDLRLRSRVWTELDRRSFTPLPAGIHAVMEDVGRQVRSGLLTAAA
jgi:UDP-glucose 4-epimerase